MKKLDKLILSSFIGPFILTFLVVVFILLTQHMLKYFDDIVGKDIGFLVLANLMFDFAIFMTPIAIPLAVLLSSLMTFGNLGEHFEITAIKSAGISLLRTLLPIFVFVIGLTVLAFYSNNYFVPKAALNAYSLLYDIKQTKPALDLKEGAFYDGIPNLSIKVNEKDSETGEIKDVIIYDHRNRDGNKQVTLADSGRMYTIYDDNYLVLELFSGQSYIEGNANTKAVSTRSSRSKAESLTRVKFNTSKLVLDLSSFGIKHTDKDLFASNRMMRNLGEIKVDLDSLNDNTSDIKLNTFTDGRYFFTYLNEQQIGMPEYLERIRHIKDSTKQAEEELKRLELVAQDSLAEKKEEAPRDAVLIQRQPIKPNLSLSKVNKGIRNKPINRTNNNPKARKQINNTKKVNGKSKYSALAVDRLSQNKTVKEGIESVRKTQTPEELFKEFLRDDKQEKKHLRSSINRVRQNKSKLQSNNVRMDLMRGHIMTWEVQWHKIVSSSFSCLVMFLIGAPLGAIIKRGGLGIPVLISIFFFIVFYVFNMTGEKWAKQGAIDPMLGVWAANIILLPIGLFFLRQARIDARLFDADFYNVMITKVKDFVNKRKSS